MNAMPGLSLTPSHKQNLSVSPKLQQAVRLLQMSSLEFSALVRAALNTNPFLDAQEPQDGDEADPRGEATDLDGLRATDAGAASANEEEQIAYGAQEDRDLWQAAPRSAAAGGDDDFSALDGAAAHGSLGEHLLGQLNLLSLSARDRLLAAAVIEALDDDGYLRLPLHDLLDEQALQPPPDADEWRIALRRVQALDPAGIGARSVAECLQLQLPSIVDPALRELAARIVEGHLHALAARDARAIAEALQAPIQQVEAACEALRRLDPRPGWRIDSAPAPYVVPDVIVGKVRGAWRVRLNPAVMPRVCMNQQYAKLFRAHRTAQHREMAAQLQEARWTVRNVEQRFATILQIAEAIVRRQSHFLEFGAMAMKPMGLREIADEIGVHESTVSRATSNKYMATPLGVFELKHFFSRAMVSANGRACSGIAIRGLVEEMIHAEADSAPLSDAAITRQLAEQGLVVARRTVTKYRQMLRIDAVEKRRRTA